MKTIPENYPGSDGHYVFNLDDVLNTEHDLQRAGGCCGQDGLNGINTLCLNGHEIGIEHSDCWHFYHYIQVPPDKIEEVGS